MLSLVQVLYRLLLNRVLDLGQIIPRARALAMELLTDSKVAED